MAIVSILNPKGGSGKTTLATNLSRAIHERGFSTLIADTDPQGSALDWHTSCAENPLTIVGLAKVGALRQLPDISANYEYTIIDGAAKLEDLSAAAIVVSDVILIPVQPSPYDIWAVSELVDQIKSRQLITDGTPKAAFLISAAIQNTRLAHEVGDALQALGFPVFGSRTIHRQVYPQTAAEGLTVFDSKNLAAIDEVNAITDELIAFIRGG